MQLTVPAQGDEGLDTITAIVRLAHQRVRRVLAERGIDTVATKLKYSKQVVAGWANLRCIPTSEKLKKHCGPQGLRDFVDIFGATPEALFSERLRDAIKFFSEHPQVFEPQPLKYQQIEAVRARVADQRIVPALEAASTAEETEALWGALKTMPERESALLIARLGLDGEPAMSLGQCAEALSLTKERIRQLERRAMRRLADNPALAKFSIPRDECTCRNTTFERWCELAMVWGFQDANDAWDDYRGGTSAATYARKQQKRAGAAAGEVTQ